MQIIRPDSWHLIGVPILFFLMAIGIGGILLIDFGIKRYRKARNLKFFLTMIIPGLFGIFFVIYNWIGYYQIYYHNSNLLIGKFKSKNSEAVLEIKSDHTWILKGGNMPCSKGTWEYEMSEDWCHWNIESENFICSTQTGSSQIIIFKGQNLEFKK